jgi:hypothetical protein
VINFDLNSVADDSTIGGFAVVVISGLLYWAGVLRPIKANAEWWATTHKDLGQVVVVDAILTSRTRNSKTVLDAALAKDPVWPRRLRARFHSPTLRSSTSRLHPCPPTILPRFPLAAWPSAVADRCSSGTNF